MVVKNYLYGHQSDCFQKRFFVHTYHREDKQKGVRHT